MWRSGATAFSEMSGSFMCAVAVHMGPATGMPAAGDAWRLSSLLAHRRPSFTASLLAGSAFRKAEGVRGPAPRLSYRAQESPGGVALCTSVFGSSSRMSDAIARSRIKQLRPNQLRNPQARLCQQKTFTMPARLMRGRQSQADATALGGIIQ